jgi:2-keto-3-deoxy-L-fuconate dehydrogenase
MLFDLSGKVAVVTGGGSGIGKAIATVFAQQNANVYVIDVDPVRAADVANELNNSGLQSYALPCDVSSQPNVINAMEKVVREQGKIDILICSAGVAHIGKLDSTKETDFDRLFNVNVRGVYNVMYAAITHMKAKKSGIILNIASVAASSGISERFAYSMSKGAVLSMTLSVAKDYVKEGIRCNSISPGRVHTPFVEGFLKANYPGKENEMFEKLSQTQPIGRMIKPQEVAHLALYLCSEEAAGITGTDFPIDGGFLKLNT